MPTVIVTGANRGIGLEFAKQYAGDGWDVIGTARRPDEAEALNALDVDVRLLDVLDPGSVHGFIARLGDRPVDLFLNNAGVYGPRTPERAGWLETFETNTVAPTLLALRLRPNVAASEQKKMAVLTSKMGSIADNQSGGSIVYRSSKAAVNAAWRSLAIDLADDGITVALLHPGWVETDMGGTNAPVDVETSVSGMRKVLADLSLDESGAFTAYDGSAIPW